MTDELPSLDEVMLAPISTREVIGAGLLPIVEREFNKCGANVLTYSRVDAWDVEGTPNDTPQHAHARRVWIEWLMFQKAVTPALPGGKAKEKRNQNLVANMADRWAAGERRAVWGQVLKLTRRRAPPGARAQEGDDAEKQREQRQHEVVALAGRGLPGKAVRHASSQGLAPDTQQTEATMRSKFPPPPAHQHGPRRPPPPPANELTQEGVVKAIHSFERGTAPGPSGHRPDFYKQVVGEKGDKMGSDILTGISNLLADGRAPKQLRPYFGGARGTALRKLAKDGTEDARPVCSGEAIRRVVGKALLATELDALRAHLQPLQLAVGVRAGVEAMPHLARQWRDDFRDDTDRVLLNTDQANAHNEVDRHTFLTRMREVAPGLVRWLEYIYPTDTATMVFYRGRVIDSAAGGQQGCPLIGACHAVVQRILNESLGLVPVPEGTAVRPPVLSPPVSLDMAPGFADDALLAGPSAEVLRALAHLKTVMAPVGLRFSTLQLVPASGARCTVDFAPFVAHGCDVFAEGNCEVLKSPVGDEVFCKAFCAKQVEKQQGTIQFLAELQNPQVTHYLLAHSVNAGRMNYLARTTPAQHFGDAARTYDESVLDAAAAAVGQQWTERQREQASFTVGGLGLRKISVEMDAAYVGSRALTHDLCEQIRPGHQWDDAVAGKPLADAMARIIATAGAGATAVDSRKQLTQSKLGSALRDRAVAKWREEGPPADGVRLNAHSAQGANALYQLTPSKTLDMQLSPSQFADNVALRLGVDVLEEGLVCPMCAMPLDAKGIHCLSCMGGGETTDTHNCIRDVFEDYCHRGGLRPVSEARGLLQEDPQARDERRPADVLVIPHLALATVLPDGSRAVRAERVCFDFAVVNALGPDHWADTALAPGLPSETYDQDKRRRNRTEERCRALGLAFRPVVFEQQGGMSKGADAAFRAVAATVAQKEGLEPAAVRREMLHRVAVLLARGCATRLARRRARVHRGKAEWRAAVVAVQRHVDEEWG